MAVSFSFLLVYILMKAFLFLLYLVADFLPLKCSYMKSNILLFTIFSLLCTQVMPQSKIEGAMEFSHLRAGRYATYLPSGFRKGKAIPVVVAFHPLNSLKWDEKSWRNELTAFAEKNQVVLICPESSLNLSLGSNAYLDFVKQMTMKLLAKYDAQPNCIYSVGAGLGANTALKLGIRHRNFVNGLILISSNTRTIDLQANEFAKCFNLPCYLIHGKNDHLQQKYYPLRKALSEAGACIKSSLIDHTGSTSNSRVHKDHLSDAFKWIHNYSCNRPEYVWNENRHLQSLRKQNEPIVEVSGMEVSLSNINPKHAINKINVYDERGILIGIIRNPSENEVILLPEVGCYTIRMMSVVRNHLFSVKVQRDEYSDDKDRKYLSQVIRKK